MVRSLMPTNAQELRIQIQSMNNVDQLTFSTLTIPAKDLAIRAARFLTVTLPIDLDGKAPTSTLEQTLANRDGFRIEFVCTDDPAKAIQSLPKTVAPESRRAVPEDMDLHVVYPPAMPKYLRIDRDVIAALQTVARLSKEYASFSVEELEMKMKRKLELELDKQSIVYKTHKQQVHSQIQRVNQQLDLCLQLKDSCVESRLQKHEIVTSLIQATNSFKDTEAKDTQHFYAQRDQLAYLEADIRKLQETLALQENEAQHYQRVKAADQTLSGHRSELVLGNLTQALADAVHHLKWLQHRNALEQGSQNKIKYLSISAPESQVEAEQNAAQHRELAQDYSDKVKALKYENASLQMEQQQQSRQVQELILKVQRLKEEDAALKKQYLADVASVEQAQTRCGAEVRELIAYVQDSERQLAELQVNQFALYAYMRVQGQLKQMFECTQFAQRHAQLKQEVALNHYATQQLQQYLTGLQSAWQVYYERAVQDMKAGLEEIDSAAMLSLIYYEAADLQDNDELAREIRALETAGGLSDSEIEAAQRELERKHLAVKALLQRKYAVFMELMHAVESCVGINDYQVRNEAERMQLQAQVEVSQSELEQLRLVARELEASLEQKKDAYKQLKKDIAQLDAESDQLRQDLEECEDELDQTQMLLQQKLLTIEQLEKETGQMAQRDRQEEKPKKAATTYKAVRGDLTDEVLARLLKDIKLLVPLARICEGWYLFGTRKIFAYVKANNLLVRVGGGFTNLKEFVDTYQGQEVLRIQDLTAKNEWDFDRLLKQHKADKSGGPQQTERVDIGRSGSATRSPQRKTR